MHRYFRTLLSEPQQCKKYVYVCTYGDPKKQLYLANQKRALHTYCAQFDYCSQRVYHIVMLKLMSLMGYFI